MHPLLLLSILATSTGCLVGDVGNAAPRGDVAVLPPGEEDLPPPAPGRAAVILAHGLDGSVASFDPQIVAAIEAGGHVVLRTEVPAVESVAVRAAALAPQVDEMLAKTGATQVHIIAHSMGGLDARYLISTLGYAPKVASLTTMSSPHRGSPIADLALGITEGDSPAALDAIIELVGQVEPEALDRALVDLSERQAVTFNATVLDAPGVRYQSYAGLATPGGIDNPNAASVCGPVAPPPAKIRTSLLAPAVIVADGFARNPSDGVVEVTSSAWGTFLGCVAADHLAQTDLPLPDQLSFETPAFYRALVDRLVP